MISLLNCLWFSDLPCYFYRNFCVKRDFVSNPAMLKKRLIVVGLAMLLLSPFLVIFMLVYLFLRHAEQFYNHPSTASSQRWSTLSKWIFREYNEVITIFISLFIEFGQSFSWFHNICCFCICCMLKMWAWFLTSGCGRAFSMSWWGCLSILQFYLYNCNHHSVCLFYLSITFILSSIEHNATM